MTELLDATLLGASIGGFVVAVGAIIIPIIRFLISIKQKVENIGQDVKHVHKCIHRIEAKLDGHIKESKEGRRKLHERINEIER